MFRELLKRETFILKKKVFAFLFCIALCSQFFFSEEYSVFRKDGLYGIINEDRKVVFQHNYDWITINPNSIVCSIDFEVEIYNKLLKLVFSDTQVNIKYYSENDILITKSMTGEKRLLNVKTEQITNFKGNENYLEEYGYRDNLELVWKKDTVGALYSIVNSKGSVILTDIKQAYFCYTNGMIALVLKNGTSGFVNREGKMVIETSFYIEPSDNGPRKYPIIRYFFNENYALVKNNEQKWVQYDIEGNVKPFPGNIEPATYCYINGLVPVLDKQTKKYGYMNPELQIVIPCEFDSAEAFVGKYAIVVKDGKDAVIDKEGKVYYCDEF